MVFLSFSALFTLTIESTSHFLVLQVMSPVLASSINHPPLPIMPESAAAASIIPASTSSASSTHICYTEDLVKFPILTSDGHDWMTWKRQFHLSTVTRGLKKHLDKKMKAPKSSDLTYDAWF